jgi:hypothetical protein
LDHGDEGLRHAILGDRVHELRPDVIAAFGYVLLTTWGTVIVSLMT